MLVAFANRDFYFSNFNIMFGIGGVNYVTKNLFENLLAGDYDIAVKDKNGCVSTNFVTIQNNDFIK